MKQSFQTGLFLFKKMQYCPTLINGENYISSIQPLLLETLGKLSCLFFIASKQLEFLQKETMRKAETYWAKLKLWGVVHNS